MSCTSFNIISIYLLLEDNDSVKMNGECVLFKVWRLTKQLQLKAKSYNKS